MRVCGQLPARDAASMRAFEAARRANLKQKGSVFESRTRKLPKLRTTPAQRQDKLIEFGAWPGRPGKFSHLRRCVKA